MENSAKIEQKLGFEKIREQLKLRCSTYYAKGRVEAEKVSHNPKTIEKRLQLTDEMRLICMFESSFPQNGFIDSIDFLKPLEVEYSSITLENMNKLYTFVENLKGVLNFFRNSKEGSYTSLKEMASPIMFFPEVSRRIESIVDRFGEVRDNATPELFNIRKSLREKENSISRKIQQILRKAQEEGLAEEDASVSARDGRLLIPVSASNKRKLPGFVYDESATGKTVFIEPIEVVELNNQVKELMFAQQREILRILREFSDFLRPYLPDLISGARFIGEIDFIRAKALVALQMEAGKPIISADDTLKIVKGRHPILEAALKKEKKPIVPLTLTLTPDKHILVISGPNAGGKSVCLKTVGMLQYMFQWGLLVPASEVSEFRIFDDIFIDIGDEQSLENDLSTYSSHLTNMKEVLQKATPALAATYSYEAITSIPITVAFCSSREPGNEAEKMLDGDPSTIWHTMYSVTVAIYPHWIDFDANEEVVIKGFKYMPRQDGGNNGNIKGYKLQVSADGKNWSEPVAEGEFPYSSDKQTVIFKKPVKARFVRFTALSSQNGQDFASGAEFELIKE